VIAAADSAPDFLIAKNAKLLIVSINEILCVLALKAAFMDGHQAS